MNYTNIRVGITFWTVNNKDGVCYMLIRYFLIINREGMPTAVIRLVIDDEKKTILDQFWNPVNNVWESGAYGMEMLTFGLRDALEGDKAFVLQHFPECPVEEDLDKA